MTFPAPLRWALLVTALHAGGGACTCSKGHEPRAQADDASADATVTPSKEISGTPGGLSAPIAAAVVSGDVVIAGLDVPAKAIRVQRIDTNDVVTSERTVFEGVAWSPESELHVAPAGRGVLVTWRGLRGGRLVRQALLLGPDLVPNGDVTVITSAPCATRDALWFQDGPVVRARPWSGAAYKRELPRDEDVALLCGEHRAFALLDDESGTSALVLGPGPPTRPISVLKDSDFGDDEAREHAEYAVDEDLGVVRLATSGAIAVREIKDGVPTALRRLTTIVPDDDDLVALAASRRIIVVVFTEEVGEACPGSGSGAVVSSARVKALRIDRTSFEESVVELSPGACGREVGPFFAGALGDDVSVAWVERLPIKGQSRAPIASFAHRRVVAAGPLAALVRLDQGADALTFAGCGDAQCYGAALVRRAGMDAMVPGMARVIRYR